MEPATRRKSLLLKIVIFVLGIIGLSFAGTFITKSVKVAKVAKTIKTIEKTHKSARSTRPKIINTQKDNLNDREILKNTYDGVKTTINIGSIKDPEDKLQDENKTSE